MAEVEIIDIHFAGVEYHLADKLKELMGDYEKEQMKKDIAVQEAVTLVADAAKVTEVVEKTEE